MHSLKKTGPLAKCQRPESLPLLHANGVKEKEEEDEGHRNGGHTYEPMLIGLIGFFRIFVFEWIHTQLLPLFENLKKQTVGEDSKILALLQ